MPDDPDLAERVAQHLAAARPAVEPPPPPPKQPPLQIYYHHKFRCPVCNCDRFDSNKMRSRRKAGVISRQIKTCDQCRYRFVLVVQ